MFVLRLLFSSHCWMRAIVIVVGLVAVDSLASPDQAGALPPVPIGGAREVIGAGVDAITGGLGSSVVDGFSALLAKLFSWPANMINGRLLAWLVAVPDYAISPRTSAGGEAG